MSMTVGFGCGHYLQLLQARDPVPEEGPWSLYILDTAMTVDTGDEMTCGICGTAQRITTTVNCLLPLTGAGKLVRNSNRSAI